jgi:hypothetical protein
VWEYNDLLEPNPQVSQSELESWDALLLPVEAGCEPQPALTDDEIWGETPEEQRAFRDEFYEGESQPFPMSQHCQLMGEALACLHRDLLAAALWPIKVIVNSGLYFLTEFKLPIIFVRMPTLPSITAADLAGCVQGLGTVNKW